MTLRSHLMVPTLLFLLQGCSNLADLAPSALAVAALDGDYDGVIAYYDSNNDATPRAEVNHTVKVEAVAPWRVTVSSDVIGEMTVTVVCEDALSQSSLDFFGPSDSLCPNLTGNYIDVVADTIVNKEPTAVELVSFVEADQWILNVEYIEDGTFARFTSTKHHPTGFL